MARNWAARCFLSGLHVCAGLAACGSLVAVVLQWAQDLNCLPPVTDGFGDPVSVSNALGKTCDVITYSAGVVCALCILMTITLNCSWGNWCAALVHQIMTLLMLTVSVGSGAALTVDFMLWCHSLQHSVGDFTGCEKAADRYDDLHKSSNMTAYFRKLELQQVCQWAVVPFLLCCVVMYSLVIKAAACRPSHLPEEGHGRGRYVIICDETAPLITVAGGTSTSSSLNVAHNPALSEDTERVSVCTPSTNVHGRASNSIGSVTNISGGYPITSGRTASLTSDSGFIAACEDRA